MVGHVQIAEHFVHLGLRFGTRRCDNCRDRHVERRRGANAASWYRGHDTNPGAATSATATCSPGSRRHACTHPCACGTHTHSRHIIANSNGTELCR
jgi:hypothetical protein